MYFFFALRSQRCRVVFIRKEPTPFTISYMDLLLVIELGGLFFCFT